jgi:DNA-binding NarL/FixJ family response regulator
MTIRVLIADDQAMVRGGLRLILEDQPDIEVIAESSDGVDAIAQARRLRPDVWLVDIRMPRLDGIEVTRPWPGRACRTRCGSSWSPPSTSTSTCTGRCAAGRSGSS